MLRIDPVDTIQKPVETAFKSKVTSRKLAEQKLLRLTENYVARDASKTLLPKSPKVTEAVNYLAKENAKVTSGKLAEQKLERLTAIL